MKLKLITCVSDINHPGLAKLKHSLDLHGWDYQVMHDPNINWNWGGWANIYQWCQTELQKPDGYTHMIYSDGFDTMALGTPEEAIQAYKSISPNADNFVLSTEKAAFPVDYNYYKPEDYPALDPKQRWRYINFGQWMTSLKSMLKMYEESDKNTVSQLWGHKKYLYHNQDGMVKLDTDCKLFQTLAFRDDTEFSVTGARLNNNYTETKPVFAHGNGRCDMQFIYDIFNL